VGPRGPAGTNGTNGTNGNTVLHGTGAPAAGLGSVGDSYIDTTAHAIYGPKTAGGWGNPTSLIGPAGTPGTSPVVGSTTSKFSVSVPTSNIANLVLGCPDPGQILVGGGGGFTDDSDGLVVEASQPVLNGSTPTDWQTRGVNSSGSTHTFMAYAVCLTTTASSGAPAASPAARPDVVSVHLTPIKP
jgi:hypothetical protein